MTILPESLTIQGIPLDPVSIPPGSSLTLERLWATEDVTFLDGTSRTYQAEKPGGWLVTLAPPDSYVAPLAVKQAVEAAYASRQPVTLTETLSDPTQERTWSGLLTERPTFTEVPGTGRLLYTYALKLKQEE